MELTDSTKKQLGETRSAALDEDNRSFLGIDLNEIPTGATPGGAVQDDDGEYEPVEVVRSIHDNPDPAPGAPAEVPEPDRDAACGACGRPESMELVVVCDACERGFHLSCVDDGVEAAPSADWMCSDCVAGGGRSKLWPLGVKSKLILDMNASPPSDAEGYGGEDTSDSRKHMLAMGNSFEHSMTHSSFLDPGRAHTLGFGFPSNLGNSTLPIRFPSLDPSELLLQNLRHFISERHGVLEDGWHVEFKQPLNGYHLCPVYCSPSGKTFSSIQDVACYLGLATNGNYSCMDTDIRNESSLLQERLNMPKRRKTSRWPNNSFPDLKGSSVSAQLSRFPYNGQTMPPFAISSGESLSSGNNGCGCEEANKGLPMQFEDFFVLSLGRIDIRQSYHNVNMIYPIGYKSCWHDKITGSLFTCEVSGGSSGPVFKITRSPCSKSFVPVGSTVFSCPKIDEMVEQNIDKRGDRRDSIQEHDDDTVEILLSDPSPPLGDDILSCLQEKSFSSTFYCLRSEVGSSQVDLNNTLSYNQQHEVEIGDIIVEEDSLSVAWQKVSQKLVDACSNVLKHKGTMNFRCKHVDRETREINWDTRNEKDNVILSLSRFCCSLAPHSATCGGKDNSEIASLVDVLSRWLDQSRFGLDADFVQEMIERMPGAESCSNYRSLKTRSSSVSVTVAEGALIANPKVGENVREEVFGEISRKAKRHKLNGGHGFSNPHPPPGRPMCLRLPPVVVGDFLQVSEVFWRFREILGLGEAFSPEKLEQEIVNPVFDGLFLDKSGKEVNRSEMNISDEDRTATKFLSLLDESRQPFSSENTFASVLKETKAGDSTEFNISNSSRGPCVGALLTKTHISLLQVLICELQSKVAAFVDPNFDSGESRSRRGRKKDDSTLSAKRNKLHMLPVNEFTWPELARRYILSLLSMDGNLESAEIAARESGKVFRCLQGDGGLLCGSLTGVDGMEADSMLLAEAIKKIFGSLTRENDVLSVEDDDSDGLDATETNACNGDIPEWALVLEPVRKLPTNVGTRIRKCVYDALERNPPEWAKKILEHSISKEVYKGNASGPTKKAVLSLLADVRGGDLVQKSVKGTKKRTSIGVSDVIMKKCRAVLRDVAAVDEDKVFCTLLGRKLLNLNDNDDDGLLGSPAMVSRPLDFRTIDLRLAVGAYDGSTEAFLEDILELWSCIRVMYADQPDSLELVEKLSKKFKSLYEAEVLPLAQKLMDYRKLECLSAEMRKEIKDIVVSVNKLPKAPWDEGVCKICGVDKDDDSVLLCNHAKSHLERSLLLLKSIPSSFDLKFRTFSLLSHCYHLLASFPPQRNLLLKALELASSVPQDVSAYLWSCNFNSQLANTFIIQADFPSSLSALDSGFLSASHICFPELQMFFTASMLHVHIMQWTDDYSVEKAVQRCDDIWQTISSDKTERCPGLFFYNEMLHVFYRLRLCDYKNAQHHVDRLDQAMNAHSHKMLEAQQLQHDLTSLDHSLSRYDLPSRERAALSDRRSQLQDRVNALSPSSTTAANSLEPAFFGNMDRAWTERLLLSQSPIDGEWLPKSAIYALVHLMVVISGRPKGLFKECSKRIESGMHIIQDELVKLGITDEVREADLRHTAIWMSGIYLMLQMQFLENKVALELTRSEYVEAQEALVEMKNLFTRFPTILQASECVIEMLRGQYSHSVGCYSEAAFHSIEASKLTESKSLQATCQAFAAVSYLTIGDADSSSKALDLIGPLYGMTNSLSGVREEASILFAYGLLLMKQQDLQEARNRLAKGLQIAHTHMSNLQLVSQYLTLLGNLALSLHDTVQAREILRSSLTLAKKLSDIPTQLWVLSSFTALYQQLGEKGSEMENEEHRKKKWDEMQSRLAEARGSIHHIELVEKARLEMHKVEGAQEQAEVTYGMQASLDIPESVGIEGPSPAQYSSRLVGLDTGKRWGKRRV